MGSPVSGDDREQVWPGAATDGLGRRTWAEASVTSQEVGPPTEPAVGTVDCGLVIQGRNWPWMGVGVHRSG